MSLKMDNELNSNEQHFSGTSGTPSYRVYFLSESGVTHLSLRGLSAVGGRASTGHAIQGLKHSDDYAVISADTKGVSLHPLKGKLKGPIHIALNEMATIADLRILVTIEPQSNLSHQTLQTSDDSFARSLASLTSAFAEPQSWEAALQTMIETVTSQFLMEKGLLVARTEQGSFEIVAKRGVAAQDPWLSQTLIEETLRLRQPRFIHNLIGSEFDGKKSLIATGFVSVFAWPLIMRGEILGVLLVGSSKPHSGLAMTEQYQADTYARLATLFLHFHLRDVQLKREIALLKSNLTPEDSPLLTQSPALIETCRLAKQVASSTLGVLIQGETGVGKELLANWVHAKSNRSSKPFVAVNCGAIPSELLESLLFGHRKGSFTGATQDQIGKFQLAHRGTLFLDEIGDLPEQLQVKLLRVLQEGVVEPLGSNKSTEIDVRVIAASHKSIPELVRTGRFREDLFYRLAEVTLHIPALRERPKDIPLLASHFLKKSALEKRLSRSAWSWLQAQEWRGNVRELASAIKRASILSSSAEITSEDFLLGHSQASLAKTIDKEFAWLGGKTLEEARARFVQNKVEEALRRSEGKRREAAELLGITQRTLFRYLEEQRKDVTDLSSHSEKDVSI